MDSTELQQALRGRVPYTLLPASLQQRTTLHDYQMQSVHYAISRGHAYHRLPDFVRVSITEETYYTEMVRYAAAQLQIYPYPHQKSLLLYVKETPLSYYTGIFAELLKQEQSYDRLPNFTAIDALNLLGIGRNQYLQLTKEVRSKLRWHVNRAFVNEYLPQELLPTVNVDAFWCVGSIEYPADVLKRRLLGLSTEEVLLYRMLVTKGTAAVRPEAAASLRVNKSAFSKDTVYAYELPREGLRRLYHRGLVYTTFDVAPDACVTVPPLEGNFVMNRTSDDPQELLLYRVLSTVDERTPLNLLAQLLMLSEEDVCGAAQLLLRLGLVRWKSPILPACLDAATLEGVHSDWQEEVATRVIAATRHQLHATMCEYRSNSPRVLGGEEGSGGLASGSDPTRTPNTATTTSTSALTADGHPRKRIALLFDATLTGFLMMTNLSQDPTFKQQAVMLFEVGKMPSEMVPAFLALLDRVSLAEMERFGGEAKKYINSVMCLRKLLRALCSIESPDGGSGVDLVKIESLNELEATTRYSVLGRNYWAYVITSPVSAAPLIDVELSCVYGSTVSFMSSPWMLLFLYAKLHRGPPSLLLPFGTLLHRWPPFLDELEEVPLTEEGCLPSRDAAAVVGYNVVLRQQAMTLDAEVNYTDLSNSLLLVNEITSTAPVFVQQMSRIPLLTQKDGNVVADASYHHLEMAVPFLAEEAQLIALVESAIAGQHPKQLKPLFEDAERCAWGLLQGSVDALRLRDSVGYLLLGITYTTRTESTEDRLYCVLKTACVVDVGLGVPLAHVDACELIVAALPRLLGNECAERHNKSMRASVEEFGEFLERYSTLTRAVHEKMTIQSTATTGPMTQLHLRKIGGLGGAPYPSTLLVFKGDSIMATDEADPLSEQW